MLLTWMLKSNNTAQCLELETERKAENYVRPRTLGVERGRDADCSILQAGGL